jgi:hypothetical protein
MASFLRKNLQSTCGSYVVVKYRFRSLPHVHIHSGGPLKVISNEKIRIFIRFNSRTKEKPYHASDMKQFVFDPLHGSFGYRKEGLFRIFVEKSSRYDGDPKGLLH